MKNLLLSSAIAGVLGVFGADGTFKTDTTGNWSDTSKWYGGVIAGDGGNVVVTNTSSKNITVNANASIGEFTYVGRKSSTLTLQKSGSNKLTFPSSGGTIRFVRSGKLAPQAGTIACDGDLTIIGQNNPANSDGKIAVDYSDNFTDGQFHLARGDNPDLKGRFIVKDAVLALYPNSKWGLIGNDLVTDAIILDGGAVYNMERNVSIDPKHGITVTENGGYFICGQSSTVLYVRSPIAGNGPVYINNQFSSISFCNPANSYTGDTIVGTTRFQSNQQNYSYFILGNSEVIPDASRLVFATGHKMSNGNLADNHRLTLAHETSGERVTETIRCVTGGKKSTTAINGEGTIVLAGETEDSDLHATLQAGITIEKRGTGAFDLTDATHNGSLVLKGGTTSTKPANMPDANSVIEFDGGSLAFTAGGEFKGGINAKQNVQITVTDNLMLSGGISTEDGVAVTFNLPAGKKLTLKGTDAKPFALDGKIICNESVEFSTAVVVTKPIEEITPEVPDGKTVTIPDGVIKAYADDALTDGATLSSSTTLFGGIQSGKTVTVPKNVTLTIDSRKFVNGAWIDDPENATIYNVNVILNGGKLVISGEGAADCTGTISGNGTIEKLGGGTYMIRDGASLTNSATLLLTAGKLDLEQSNIGGAKLKSNGNGMIVVQDVKIYFPGVAGTMTQTGNGSEINDFTMSGGYVSFARKTESPEFDVDADGLKLPETWTAAINATAGIVLKGLDCDLSGDRSIAGAGSVTFAGETKGNVNLGEAFTGDVFVTGVVADGDESIGITTAAGKVFMGGSATYSGDTKIGAAGSVTTKKSLTARYFRLKGLKDAYGRTSGVAMQLDELDILLNGKKIFTPEGTTVTVENDSNNKVVNPGKIIDGGIDGNYKIIVSSAEQHAVVIRFPEDVEFDGYALWTGNDCIFGNGRDRATSYFRHPVSWTFEYSTDGKNWTTLDNQQNNWMLWDTKKKEYVDLSSMTNALMTKGSDGKYPNENTEEFLANCKNAKFYTFDVGNGEGTNRLSANSLLDLDGVGNFETTAETVKGLKGAGTINLANDTQFIVAPGAETAFGGVLNGGVFVKAGEGVQTLGGTIASGEIVVDGGILNLDNAALNGVTNIVLNGGAITGSATCAGDLTITCAGGAYGADIAVAGALNIVRASGADFVIHSGYVGKNVRSRLFSWTSLDAASREILRAALLKETIPGGWNFSVFDGETEARFAVVEQGMVLIIK